MSYVYPTGVIQLPALPVDTCVQTRLPDQSVRPLPITPVTGYRQLSPEEVALMNEAKAVAITVGDLVSKIAATPGVDMRWVSIGKTDLQTGFMALIRGVAQPTTF